MLIKNPFGAMMRGNVAARGNCWAHHTPRYAGHYDSSGGRDGRNIRMVMGMLLMLMTISLTKASQGSASPLADNASVRVFSLVSFLSGCVALGICLLLFVSSG